MAQPSNNPFGGLVTPDVLKAQREAEFAQKYQNADPWVAMAAKAGFDYREAARARGIGLEDIDKKAKRNESIMSGAQTRYAQLVRDGKMDASEAQAAVLEEAIAGFSANGEWEQALALTQPLNTLITQSNERRKLKADAAWAEQRPDVETAKAEATLARAEAALQNAQTNEDKSRYMSELTLARAELARAQADWNNRRKDGGEGGGKDPANSVTGLKERIKSNEHALGASSALRLMSDIREVGLSDPGALTQAGPISTAITTVGASARALIAGAGYENPYLTKEAQEDVRGLVARNITDQKLQAKVVDLAFAFARVRDPGGRLSNQDVEMAMKIVTGTGSPAARLAVLDDAYLGLTADFENYQKSRQSLGVGATDEALLAVKENRDRYEALRAQGQKGQKGRATAAPAPSTGTVKVEWQD